MWQTRIVWIMVIASTTSASATACARKSTVLFVAATDTPIQVSAISKLLRVSSTSSSYPPTMDHAVCICLHLSVSQTNGCTIQKSLHILAQPSACTKDSQCVDYGHCENGRCACNNVCPDNYDPVCGSDGHTYANLCDMQETACQEHKMVISAHKGACSKITFYSALVVVYQLCSL